jgi:hypothetical protein
MPPREANLSRCASAGAVHGRPRWARQDDIGSALRRTYSTRIPGRHTGVRKAMWAGALCGQADRAGWKIVVDLLQSTPHSPTSLKRRVIMKHVCVGAICLVAPTLIIGLEASAEEPEVGVAVSELGHHRDSRAIPLLRGDSLWELSTAVAPPGSHGCPAGRFFVSVGVSGGGSMPGTDDNAVLLRGRLDCSRDFE